MGDLARYAFKAELPNELAGVNDDFHLFYYQKRDGRDEVELVKLKGEGKVNFLKRTHIPGLSLSDINVGSKVVIFSRQYLVTGYLDEATQRALGTAKETAAATCSLASVGPVWSAIETAGLKVAGASLVVFDKQDANKLSSFTAAPIAASEPMIVLNIIGADAFLRAAAAGGASGSNTAIDKQANQAMCKLLFGASADQLPSLKAPRGRLRDCTCVLILPSAVSKGRAGAILTDLVQEVGRSNEAKGLSSSVAGTPSAAGSANSAAGSSGAGSPLRITALGMAQLTRPRAEKFLEVYKGVAKDYIVSGDDCAKSRCCCSPKPVLGSNLICVLFRRSL